MSADGEPWQPGPEWRRYEELAADRPDLFVNGDDARFEIVFDPALVADAQHNEASRVAALGRDRAEARVGVVFEDSYITVVRDAVRFPNGHLGTYLRVVPASASPGVAVLPLVGGRIVLVRHYRHATRREHLEIPRGFASNSSSPESDARRELLEEIGAEATALVSLGSMNPNTGITSEVVQLFLAEVDTLGVMDTNEGIDAIVPLAVDELAGEIESGRITDSFTIIAFARAQLRGLV